MQTYIFCENNISEYEKTIISLAISFANSPICTLKEEDVVGLSNFLQVDLELLKKALSYPEDGMNFSSVIKFGETEISFSKLYDNTFFVCLIRIYYIYESFGNLKSGVDYNDLRFNLELFHSINHNFDMLHASMATFECMHKGAFSYDDTVFCNCDFDFMDFINLLQLYLCCGDSIRYNKSFISLIYLILQYEMRTRINTLHLILITQIFKHSLFGGRGEKIIAGELYEYLLFILKNGRVISVQTNLLYVSENKKELRRRTDNTTRMQIIYGYGNFDTYVLRLDLGHNGEEYIHWNNKSPGGLKCCIFNDAEYRAIIKVYPEMESCFIQYDSRWALKERINCEFSEVSKVVYENVQSKKENETGFYDSEERVVISFVEMMSKMLPLKCNVAIDVEEIHARNCFNLDKIMCYVYMFYLLLLNESDDILIQKIIDFIVDRAIQYGIILQDEKSDYLNIEGVCLIVEEMFGIVNL